MTGGIDGSHGFAVGLWSMLKDGGVWGVPRCGLVFTKDEANSRLVLTERMTWQEGMPHTPEDLRESQDYDFHGIRTLFALIGVKVIEEVEV